MQDRGVHSQTQHSTRDSSPDADGYLPRLSPFPTASLPRSQPQQSSSSISPSKHDGGPPKYRLSKELDDLLRWEGLDRPRASREEYSFRHEDIVEMLEHAGEDNNDAKQPNRHDDEVDDSMSFSDMNDILASAKRKLDLLEGNLKGARHSLLLAPCLPSLTSTASSKSTPSTSSKTSPLTSSDEGRNSPDLQDIASAPAPLVAYSISRRNDSGHGRLLGKAWDVKKSSVSNHNKRQQRSDSDMNNRSPPRSSYDNHSFHGSSDEEIPPMWSISRHNRTTSSTGSLSRSPPKTRQDEIPGSTFTHYRQLNEALQTRSHNVNNGHQIQSSNQTSGRPSSDLNGPHPLTPHENRADAFDYENHLLRSNLPTFTPRRPSNNSVHSTATARESHHENAANETSPTPISSNKNHNFRESYSTTGTSITTDTDSVTAGEDWDSESDISNDQDLDELLHADLKCKWPMPPASQKKPSPVNYSAILQPPPAPPPPPLPRPAAITFEVVAPPSQQAPPPVPPAIVARPRPRKAQPSVDIPKPHNYSRPSTSTSQPVLKSPPGSSKGPKSLDVADQALVLALSEAMRDACLQVRDGPEQEQVLWRMRIEAATRVLLAKGK